MRASALVLRGQWWSFLPICRLHLPRPLLPTATTKGEEETEFVPAKDAEADLAGVMGIEAAVIAQDEAEAVRVSLS